MFSILCQQVNCIKDHLLRWYFKTFKKLYQTFSVVVSYSSLRVFLQFGKEQPHTAARSG